MLEWLVREDLTEKVTFKQSTEEGSEPCKHWGKNVSERKDSKCKGPEIEMSSMS